LDAKTIDAPSLDELQRWLRWIITDPRGVDGALSGDPGAVHPRFLEPEPLPRRLETVLATPSASSAARISIYSSGYFWRLFESLASDFPAVQRALGPALFQNLVAEYLMRHPSQSTTLADLGSALPGFAIDHELSKDSPFLPDLASLEWNVHLSLLSPRARFAGPPWVQESEWSSLRLRLDPTVRLLTTEWAMASFWNGVRANKPALTSPQRRRQWLLVYRDDVWVQVRAISRSQWSVLLRLQQGCPLAWVCEQLVEEFPRKSGLVPVGDWFARWMRSGLIAGIEPAA